MSILNLLRNPSSTEVGDSVEAFLKFLGGPTCIILDGENNKRCRVYVTLLHGNEPSGIMALHRWLKQPRTPSVRIVCIVASVNIALQAPMFHYRTLPGVRDLNRCFHPPFNDAPGLLAKAILDIIYQYQPEAVIDVHNTSGSGPAFGVATHKDRNHEALISPFSDKLVITHLTLGALMDISESFFPTVTVEAGGRLDQEAHDIAWQGLQHYFTEQDILQPYKTDWAIHLLMEPIRIELKEGLSLSYASTPNTEFNITLLNDLDRLNFSRVDTETPLGWINRGEIEDSFIIQDCNYHSGVNDWLRVEDGLLFLAQTVTLFMITTNPVIAIDDCAFYIAR